MRNMLKHAIANPFVAATAIAAFIHSSWSVSTLFGGMQPDPSQILAFLGWLVPGVLLAFSLDIGLLSTANKLARGESVRGLRITFFVLATMMYILQWVFIIHHVPALQLSDGVRDEWRSFVTLLRDMMVWIIPALLPVSVTLYTFSSSGIERTEINRQDTKDAKKGYENRDTKRAGLIEGMMGTDVIVVNGKEEMQPTATPFSLRRKRKK